MGGKARICGMLTVLVLLEAAPLHAAAQASGERALKDGAPRAAASQAPAGAKKAGDETAQNTAKSAITDADKARQEQIVADTQRLLLLAQELKLEVAKSNKDILSMDVVKRADEIEKLAKSLKERMRTD